MKNSKKNQAHSKKYHKIVNYIVQKDSPSSKENDMGIADEAEASLAQEGKKNKLKNNDLRSNNFR